MACTGHMGQREPLQARGVLRIPYEAQGQEACHRGPAPARRSWSGSCSCRVARRCTVGIITLIGAIVVIVVVLKLLGLW
jgi:hypothetical protein